MRAHQAILGLLTLSVASPTSSDLQGRGGREQVNLNKGWRFWRSVSNPDGIVYDFSLNQTDAIELKPWILPSGNEFIKDPKDRHSRPDDEPEVDIDYVKSSFDDQDWEKVDLPHDWAIKGPFYTEEDPIIGGGMGRLPVHGVGWYRRQFTISKDKKSKTVLLNVGGAMAYAMVWLNGHLVGGWPYGYNSFNLDLTPFIRYDGENQLAIRLDNAPDSSRWYPGAGLYRSVSLTFVEPTHVSPSGTYITTRDVSDKAATVDISVQVQNDGKKSRTVEVYTDIYSLDQETSERGQRVAKFPKKSVKISSAGKSSVNGSVTLQNPRLWGPPPNQVPNLYLAITSLKVDGQVVDTYETQFGIRSLVHDGEKGLLVNGEHVPLQGVNQHSDLGALGMAFNVRAATRQLEILQEMGCNAIRMAHNPPATELLHLADKMGFLIIDEIFDAWYRKKTSAGFHLLFSEWHEPDLRAFLRRDRNHPSIIVWSYGNEVGEQYTDEEGAQVSKMLHEIVREEDPTRPTTASMNYAKPNMPFAKVLDIKSINYQGSGIRDTEAYSNLEGIKTHPIYPDFHEAFPNNMILGSETSASVSSRGVYYFPVTNYTSAPVNDTSGGNSTLMQVSSYELYSAPFGSSPDKVFKEQDKAPYVAGEFVWSGFDYLGEPTPYYTARSSYFGMIDLAGFKKDRYWLYQSRWRPDLRFAHILPHWTWPERKGQVTPVHVFSQADEAELFLNGESQGRQTREQYEYRFRWDDVVYEPGELRVVTYKDGKEWAKNTVKTAGEASNLKLSADRTSIQADGEDLAFVTLKVVDSQGNLAPRENTPITFSLSGPGEIVATDNGNAADFVAFHSPEREAFNGMALAIVRFLPGAKGSVTIAAAAKGLKGASVVINPQK
ncbi:hypothetical protein FDECE_439 [Fusarium decemcellulare]|nr:hypothetical protein FDECE_439 [Fusarium decemcellulare]